MFVLTFDLEAVQQMVTVGPGVAPGVVKAPVQLHTKPTCPEDLAEPWYSVDVADLQFLAAQWREPTEDYDCDAEGRVTAVDLLCVAKQLGQTCATTIYGLTQMPLDTRRTYDPTAGYD